MKTKVFFLAALLVPFITSAQQKAESVSKGTYMSNGVFITLLAVIILLAIMIAGMVEMVKASATHRARKEKDKRVDAEKNNNEEIKQIILSGGSALLPGIDVYFTNMLGIQVVIGSGYDVHAIQNVPEEIKNDAPSYNVVVGLALRDS